MDVRSLAFRTDLALLTLAGSEFEDRGSHLVVRTPNNPGYRWGNFYLLGRPPHADEVDAIIATYDADFPRSPHRAFGVDGTANQREALVPLASVGLRIDRATVMTATAVHPPPRPNTEAAYRPLTSDDDWAQRVEVSIAVEEDDDEAETEGYLAFATQRALDDRALCEAGHGAWWGAFVDGRLVSVMGLVNTGDGLARYQSVETRPRFRGRGLAGTLVHRVAAYGFDEMGARTLVMVADPEYAAIRIYRSVGFDGTETQTQLEQRNRATTT
ncbi:MAG TPA: GNAT family N-acetyltransferase [Nocardioidaceae bacterium]|nr:GNAT family N-acetyltransferase [Nocardioidaceae bacterium]